MKKWALLMLLFLPSGAEAATQATVLFDQGHGQMFVIEQQGALQLSGLAELIRQNGGHVRAEAGPLSEATLSGAPVLVSSGPFTSFSAPEIEALVRFIERGGRFVLLLHVGPPASGLLDRLGVSHSNGVIRDERGMIGEQPLDFWVDRFEPHTLFAGVERFGVFGGWALVNNGEGARLIARTGDQAWVDLDRDGKRGEGDASQSFGVVAEGKIGEGCFLVFGDDAIFQNRYLEEYNLPLGRNLVRWLLAEQGEVCRR